MATKIINQHTTWQPVTIEMTFETYQQLAVWVAFTGNQNAMGDAISFHSRNNEHSVISHMTSAEASAAISELVDMHTWEQLKNILKNNS